MKNINLKINFFQDDGIDINEFTVTVPDNISKDNIIDALQKEHEYLCMEDETDTYGIYDKCPVTLLNYVCEKNNWQWNNFEFDINLNFN